MTGTPIEIRSATPEEMPQVISTIVAAFLTDPIMRFAWPSPHDYLQAMPVATPGFAGGALQAGSADIEAAFGGAALWLPPGVHPDGALLEGAFRELAEPAHLGDLFRTFVQMEQCHPSEPHWYLPMIGVEPYAQGRGIGGALMRHAVARCDRDGTAAFLESSNPRNISLYERHGFEVVGQIQVGAAPVVTPMLRPPR